MSVFLLIFGVFGLAALYLLWFYLAEGKPLEIMNLSYDVNANTLDLTVKNKDHRSYNLFSSLRMQESGFPENSTSYQDSSAEDQDMLSGSANTSQYVGKYALIDEDLEANNLEPQETKTFTYYVSDDFKLKKHDPIKVSIFYGGGDERLEGTIDQKIKLKLKEKQKSEISDPIVCGSSSAGNQKDFKVKEYDSILELLDEIESEIEEKDQHPYLSCVSSEHSFKLKTGHADIIEDIFFLEDLAKAVNNVPDQAISFHLERGNDFASWVRDVIGDQELSKRLEKIEQKTPKEAREKIVEAMEDRIIELEGGLETIFDLEEFSGKE
ncbi:MAG: DUF5752 family protein [Candidatus Altiarchaeota archaeon]